MIRSEGIVLLLTSVAAMMWLIIVHESKMSEAGNVPIGTVPSEDLALH